MLEFNKEDKDFKKFCSSHDCDECPFGFTNEIEECMWLFNEICNKTRDIKHDVYIAAPFFNEAQVERVKAVESLLDKLGLTYFSPRKDSACENIHNPEVRKKVFKLNEENILAARQVIAITDDKDPGTIFEAGLAYKKVPLTYIAFTLRDDQLFNLMLAESADCVVRNIEQLEKHLTTGENFKYTGLIE